MDRNKMSRPLSVWLWGILLALLVLCAAPVRVQAANASASQIKKLADKVVKKQTKKIKKKDKAARLEKLFRYADNKYKYKAVADKAFIEASLKKKMGKTNLRNAAYTMLKKKKGTCFHEAAALAWLIKRGTGYQVKVVIGTTDAFSGKEQAHAWVEVKVGGKWLICDSNLDRAKGKKLTWFRIPTDGSDERSSHYQAKWKGSVK